MLMSKSETYENLQAYLQVFLLINDTKEDIKWDFIDTYWEICSE